MTVHLRPVEAENDLGGKGIKTPESHQLLTVLSRLALIQKQVIVKHLL